MVRWRSGSSRSPKCRIISGRSLPKWRSRDDVDSNIVNQRVDGKRAAVLFVAPAEQKRIRAWNNGATNRLVEHDRIVHEHPQLRTAALNRDPIPLIRLQIYWRSESAGTLTEKVQFCLVEHCQRPSRPRLAGKLFQQHLLMHERAEIRIEFNREIAVGKIQDRIVLLALGEHFPRIFKVQCLAFPALREPQAAL